MSAIRHLLVLALLVPIMSCGALAADSTATNTHEGNRSDVLDDLLDYFVRTGATAVYTVKKTSQKSLLDGPFAVFNTNGVRLVAGACHDGKLQGKLVFWHSKGKMSSEQQYEEGKPVGTETFWSANGSKLRTTHYVDGEKDGLEVYWNKRGEPDKQLQWKSGRLVVVELFANGSLQKRFVGSNTVDYVRQEMKQRQQKTSSKIPVVPTLPSQE